MKHHSSQSTPSTPKFGADHLAPAPSTSRTADPIVVFKQFRRSVSMPEGKATSEVEFSAANTAVLLYPSTVNATELAR